MKMMSCLRSIRALFTLLARPSLALLSVAILAVPAAGQTPPAAKTFADMSNWWATAPFHVIKVNSLDPGPGDATTRTYRWALNEARYSYPAADKKIILFEISGKIDYSNTTIDNGTARLRLIGLQNTYIAGESAPSPGITIVGVSHQFRQCNRVLFRHIRFRLGLPASYQGTGVEGNGNVDTYGDTISFEGPANDNGTIRDTLTGVNEHVGFEHCEFSWSLDETVQFWYTPNRNISFVRCMFYDGFRYAIDGWRHPDTYSGGGGGDDDLQGHAYAFITMPSNKNESGVADDVNGGNKRIDVQHSVFGNYMQRSPRAGSGSGILMNGNLIFTGTNQALMVSDGTYNSFLNYIDNLGMRTNTVLQSGSMQFGWWWHTPGASSKIFADNNVGLQTPAGQTISLGPRTAGWSTTAAIQNSMFLDSLVPESTPATFTRWAAVSAAARLSYLKANAGARPADLNASGVRTDPASKAFVDELRAGVGTYKNAPLSPYTLASTPRAIAAADYASTTALQTSINTWRSQVELPASAASPLGTTYQAENATVGGGTTIDSNNAAYIGTGFANFPLSGGSLQFNNVDGNGGGSKVITFRYAFAGATARTGQLIVNGGAATNITFAPTGSFSVWQVVSATVTLNNTTTNTVRLQSNGQDLGNIDELTVAPRVGLYQAENATAAGGVVIENSQPNFNGTGYANFPATNGTLTFSNVSGNGGGNKVLAIRYAFAGASARAGQVIVNGGTPIAVSMNPTGSFSTWSTQNVTVPLNNNATNTIVLKSTGQDLGNVDQIIVP